MGMKCKWYYTCTHRDKKQNCKLEKPHWRDSGRICLDRKKPSPLFCESLRETLKHEFWPEYKDNKYTGYSICSDCTKKVKDKQYQTPKCPFCGKRDLWYEGLHGCTEEIGCNACGAEWSPNEYPKTDM